ncbi:transcriptional regulator [Massilia aurea]|uniref:Transcriptional regulator n=1 Tax=Massilia aurea TaxID=373040 RepID=A0A422QIK4_9BURK|nr:LysR family transcriptional regulator [Massilia aurea]RNF29805.1 transcriptional regulator [Massilia aurea]
MDKVKAMQTFVRIVEANSFTKAAESLNLPRASLTATMQNLERHLGAQLLQRTTRRLSLTRDGERYYEQCAAILAAIETAEADFLGVDGRRMQGRLRIDLPGALGRAIVLPRIAEFRHAWPGIELSIGIGDRLVDLTGEGIDCALRVGELPDSSLVARRIGLMQFTIAAAPDYLARRGVPSSLDELAGHDGIVHFSGRTGRAFDWELQEADGVRKVAVKGSVSVNDADANLILALQGLGLTQLARYQLRGQAGRLVEVLPGVCPTPMPVSLLYPQGGIANPRLRAFSDWLAGVFDADPDLRLAHD